MELWTGLGGPGVPSEQWLGEMALGHQNYIRAGQRFLLATSMFTRKGLI